MTAEKLCLRCGGSRLISAHQQNPMAFFIDHDTRHGMIHLALKALVCQDCGHVEFWTPDPSQIVGQQEIVESNAIQEEDF